MTYQRLTLLMGFERHLNEHEGDNAYVANFLQRTRTVLVGFMIEFIENLTNVELE